MRNSLRSLPGAVVADAIRRRNTTLVFLGIGRLTLLWDTGKRWPDRRPGDA